MDIGIIGNGGHSKRIQKILKKKKIFIYKPSGNNSIDSMQFEILKKKKLFLYVHQIILIFLI